MRFDLSDFINWLKGQYPDGLADDVWTGCSHPGCRSNKIGLGVSYVEGGSGQVVPLLVHVDGMDAPVCYMCYRSHYGGGVEDYASFLVREHGLARGEIPEFQPPPTVAFIARPRGRAPRQAAVPRVQAPKAPALAVPARAKAPAPKAPSVPAQAPAPRPARVPPPRGAVPTAPVVGERPKAPAPDASRVRAPKVEAPRAPARGNQPKAPAPAVPARAKAPPPAVPARASMPTAAVVSERPRAHTAPPAPRRERREDRAPARTGQDRSARPAPVTELSIALKGVKTTFKDEAERKAFEAAREAEADAKWLAEACARGIYRVAGTRPAADGVLLVHKGEPVFYDGGITGVIVGEGKTFVGAEESPALVRRSLAVALDLASARWKWARAVTQIDDNGTPVTVMHCDSSGVIHKKQLQLTVPTVWFRSPEPPAWQRRNVPTEDAGVVDNTSGAAPRRIGFDGFSSILLAALDATMEEDSAVQDWMSQTIATVGLVRLGRLWDTALDVSAALDELNPNRTMAYRAWMGTRAAARDPSAESPATENTPVTLHA